MVPGDHLLTADFSRKLYLTDNRISDAGAAFLADAFSVNRTISHVCVPNRDRGWPGRTKTTLVVVLCCDVPDGQQLGMATALIGAAPSRP